MKKRKRDIQTPGRGVLERWHDVIIRPSSLTFQRETCLWFARWSRTSDDAPVPVARVDSMRSRMLSTAHAVLRGPSFTGFG